MRNVANKTNWDKSVPTWMWMSLEKNFYNYRKLFNVTPLFNDVIENNRYMWKRIGCYKQSTSHDSPPIRYKWYEALSSSAFGVKIIRPIFGIKIWTILIINIYERWECHRIRASRTINVRIKEQSTDCKHINSMKTRLWPNVK